MQDIESMRSPHQQQAALKCPRCESVNTKFCYYNNYNLSQPRHFCKGCRRYWTRGGVLRNVPVGGGCRKTKRSSNPKPLTCTTATPPDLRKSSSHSHSSSEGSSITAAPTVSPPSSCVTATEPQVLATSLIASSNDPILKNVADNSQLRMREEQQKKMMIVDCEEDDKIKEMLELTGDGGFGSLDWATLPNTYWSHTQWNDPTLFLP